MQDHTPPTWFMKRLDREEPTDAVPVGEMGALAAAYERAMERHYASIQSLDPNRLGTCAPAEVPDLREVISTLEPVQAWRHVVAMLQAIQDQLEGRDAAPTPPSMGHADTAGCLDQGPGSVEEYQEAQQVMQRALQMPGGWVAYAASFLPDDPEETLLVLCEYGQPYAHTTAYGLLRHWAEETIQRIPGKPGLLESEAAFRTHRGELECPGD